MPIGLLSAESPCRTCSADPALCSFAAVRPGHHLRRVHQPSPAEPAGLLPRLLLHHQLLRGGSRVARVHIDWSRDCAVSPPRRGGRQCRISCVLTAQQPNDVDCHVPVSHEAKLGTEFASYPLLLQGSLATGTFAGLDSLVLTLTSASPSVSAVLGNSGHPELSAFVDSLSSGSASLEVTITPGFYTDGSNALTFSGTCASACVPMLHVALVRRVSRTPLVQWHLQCLLSVAFAASLVSRMSISLLLGRVHALAARNVCSYC